MACPNRVRRTRGFTLIELLVVIAIIGLLSSVVLASLNTAREKARDAQRASSIRQVQLALELYYDDHGAYPSAPDVNLSTLSSSLVPNYMGQVPVDPNNSTPYRYYNNSQNPATYYAIKVSYETKDACYVCAGSYCSANRNFWSLDMCQ